MPNLYQGDSGSVEYFPPKPVRANPGPAARGSYAGGRSSSPGHPPAPPPTPPPDIFGAYVGPEVDAARQIAQQFLANLDFPRGVDANSVTLYILSNHLTSNPQGAAESLVRWSGLVGADVLKSHPWAQFGLDATTYTQRVDTLQSAMQLLVGQQVDISQLGNWTTPSVASGLSSLQNTFWNALKGNWSQTQILQTLQQDQALVAAQPWLAQGQGEQQASQTFASLYGSAPVDTGTLASWFRFNTGTMTLNRTGREAVLQAAPTPGATEAR